MPDSANLRKKPVGVTNPVVAGPSRSTCVHPSGAIGVGVVKTAGEYCLVATREIPAGQQILRIEGDLTHQPSRYSVQVGYQLHIDLGGERTLAEILDRYCWRFMNHSCNPSALVRERDVIAARNIGPWEPVTFNYNTTEWEMAEPFACGCGGRNCLGQVQGFRFLDPAQRAQLGPVAPHISRQLVEASVLTAARATKPPRHGVARVVSKLGLGSRTQAAQWVSAGRVRVNGQVVHDAEFPVRQGLDRVDIDGQASTSTQRLVLMLNKPRGLVTTVKDEQGRDTVYRCFEGADLPWLAPVGRLDKASEGLLLFSNDPVWAAGITDPKAGQSKTYHVQIDRLPDAALLAVLEQGVVLGDERLAVMSARCLRSGGKNAWLEVILDEGRNRQIRRLLAALDVSVLRLVRVAVGHLYLGDLPKGQWRMLTGQEIDAF